MRILAILMVIALATTASAGGVFDFLGQANLPAGVTAGPLTMVGQLHDPAPLVSPLALDFGANSYTICLECVEMTSDTGTVKTFGPCSVSLHENPVNDSDYSDPAGFCTGTTILSGSMDSLTRTTLISWLHNVSGSVNWTGGTMLGDLNPLEYAGWAVLCTANSNSPHAPNMDEVWDGKIEREDVVDIDDNSFGAIKALYR